MAISNIRTTLDADIKIVWKIMTSPYDYSWRSDLSNIEIIEPGKTFIEYTKDNHQINFTITVFEPMERYEFYMENDNLKGYWIGKLTADGDKTIIDFTEDVQAKKLIMKPFLKTYLKKQQALYVRDLKRHLEQLNADK